MAPSWHMPALDAVWMRARSFLFAEKAIRLIRTTGAFVAMNPGYLERTELPESFQAFFRSVAMVVLTFVISCTLEVNFRMIPYCLSSCPFACSNAWVSLPEMSVCTSV